MWSEVPFAPPVQSPLHLRITSFKRENASRTILTLFIEHPTPSTASSKSVTRTRLVLCAKIPADADLLCLLKRPTRKAIAPHIIH